MINIKNSLLIGSSGRGLYITGALVLGNGNKQDSGVSVIDLTSPTLDPRITFTGPHFLRFMPQQLLSKRLAIFGFIHVSCQAC